MATLRIHLPEDLAQELREALGFAPGATDIDIEANEATSVLIRRFVEELAAFVQQQPASSYEAALPCAACSHPAEWHAAGTCDASFYNDEPCACLAYTSN